MWLLVVNVFFGVLRTTRSLSVVRSFIYFLFIYLLMILLSIVRILYSLMLIILLSFIVGIVVNVKLVRFSYIFIMYCKYNLHSNNFFVYLFSLIKILQSMLEVVIKMWTKIEKITLRRKTLKRRTMTHTIISLPYLCFQVWWKIL